MSHHQKIYLLGIVLPWGFIAIAYFYFQQYLALHPCPLCMFQRAALVAISITCLLAISYAPSRFFHRLYSILVALFAAIGMGIAGRQVWLQSLPADQVPECGFDPVYRWLESGSSDDYNFMQMLATALKGSGDCAAVDWSFLGLSIAAWMIVIFSAFVLFAVVRFFRV